jgi:hypothetical protein
MSEIAINLVPRSPLAARPGIRGTRLPARGTAAVCARPWLRSGAPHGVYEPRHAPQLHMQIEFAKLSGQQVPAT